jgi:hypothetical protein
MTEGIDMSTTAATSGFLAWFAEWGQVAYIAVQMLFWIAVAAAALIIALQYKRYVSHKVGDGAASATADEKAEPAVEVFVE